MVELSQARVHAVVGDSVRLRDEILATLTGAWNGPVKRVTEPADPQRILLDLDTPSFLEEPALWVLRADEKYLRKHQEALLGAAAKEVANGCLVLVVPGLEAKDKLAKALAARKALHIAAVPGPKEIVEWLCARLAAIPEGVERPSSVAEELVEHVGAEPDALLATLDLAVLYAGGQPLDVAAVRAVANGTAERPIYEFTGAFLEGNARKAIDMIYAGGGIEPQPALSALVGETRKLIACCETSDDGDAVAWAGGRGRGNLYYARKRARDLGRATLLRLLQGMVLAQRQMRQSGNHGELTLELLALNAQRVVRGR